MDAHIAKLYHDMDAQLYPHMLTAVAGRRWVISHDFRLAVMKHAQSIECRAALRKVISMAINKGIQEGLEAGIEHGRASRSLAEVDAYDFEVEAAHVAAVNEFENRGGSSGPDSISHEILLSDALATLRARSEEHKKARLQIGGPSVVTPSLSSQGASFVAADHHVSSAANVGGAVSSSEPHDDLFDATVLDKPVDS
ncbi:hypothetical protein Tco_1048268 [Tanacetum coccineum]